MLRESGWTLSFLGLAPMWKKLLQEDSKFCRRNEVCTLAHTARRAPTMPHAARSTYHTMAIFGCWACAARRVLCSPGWVLTHGAYGAGGGHRGG
jgi:hypothetical protein